jgi:hypothetical protein
MTNHDFSPTPTTTLTLATVKRALSPLALALPVASAPVYPLFYTLILPFFTGDNEAIVGWQRACYLVVLITTTGKACKRDGHAPHTQETPLRSCNTGGTRGVRSEQSARDVL